MKPFKPFPTPSFPFVLGPSLKVALSVLVGAAALGSCGSSSGDDSGGGTNPGGETPPVASDDSASVQPGQSVLINVLANDFVFGGALNPGSVAIAETPALGTATVDAQGRILYEADLAVQGVDTFTYTVAATNGLVSDEATVSVLFENAGGSVSFQSVEILGSTSAGFEHWEFAGAAALEGGSYDAAAMYLQDDGPGSNLSIRSVSASGALGPLHQYEFDYVPSSDQCHAFSVADGGALFIVGGYSDGGTYFHLGSEGVMLASGLMPAGAEGGTFMSCGQVMLVKSFAAVGEPLAFTFDPATSAFVAYLTDPQGGYWYPQASSMLPASESTFFTFSDQDLAEPTTLAQEWSLGGVPIGGETVLPIEVDSVYCSISSQGDGSFSMNYAPGGTYARRVTYSPGQGLAVEEIDPLGGLLGERHAHAGSAGPSVSVAYTLDGNGDQVTLETRWQSAPGLPYYYSSLFPSPFLYYFGTVLGGLVCDSASGTWLVQQTDVLFGAWCAAHWNEDTLTWDFGYQPSDPMFTLQVAYEAIPARDEKILIFNENIVGPFVAEVQYLVTIASAY